MLREGCERLAKDAAFRTTASAAHQCATYPGFLFLKGTPESGASTKGRLGAGAVPESRHPAGTTRRAVEESEIYSA